MDNLPRVRRSQLMAVNQPAKALIAKWKRDPVSFVVENFGVVPDPWQAEALKVFPDVQRLGFKSAKGPGKTCLIAWFILNFLATRSESKIAATSITADNLHHNLWAEVSKWLARSEWMKAKFTWTKTQVQCNESENWFAVAKTWSRAADPQQQANTLAGHHADHTLFVLDESGGMPQSIMTTAEASLASGRECKIVQAGNPTHLEGPLHRACVQDRALWHMINITGDPDNPMRSPRINIEWARQQIASYGRDNPWVMVNVLGEFPPSSLNSLLGVEEVESAMARHLILTDYNWSQKRLGVDVARFGDDRSVIFPRQGRASFRPHVMRHQRTTDIAAQVAKAQASWGGEAVFIDDTGHWGHGVIDNLYAAGIPSVGIQFHAPALDPRYKNRRAEMWLTMADWVKNGAALPPIPDMVGELTVPTYTFNSGKFQLEDKDQIKERLGRSPDLADALALTFAVPDQPAAIVSRAAGSDKVKTEWDPFPAHRE